MQEAVLALIATARNSSSSVTAAADARLPPFKALPASISMSKMATSWKAIFDCVTNLHRLSQQARALSTRALSSPSCPTTNF
eukprot:3804234-Pleurochrysis_carterae.AAC.1